MPTLIRGGSGEQRIPGPKRHLVQSDCRFLYRLRRPERKGQRCAHTCDPQRTGRGGRRKGEVIRSLMEVTMEEETGTAIAAGLKAPRAGAIAGIVFSILFIISVVLIRLSVPDSPGDPGTWLAHSAKSIGLALDLLPFAGIAFLWFMGVLRDRMGAKEDRFLATVFLGSGLLFLAITFAASAVTGGLMMAYESNSRKGDGLRHLYVCPHPGVRVSQRIRAKDGGRIHDLDLHARDPHRDVPALDGVARICAGAFSAPEHRTFRLGPAGLSAVGAGD